LQASSTVEKQVEVLHRLTEDSNEVLFFVQDIFSSCKQTNAKITNQLSNALLNFAYFPVIVQSLCVLKLKPHLQLSSCLYILTQTFHIIKDQSFLSSLFRSIFGSKLAASMVAQIERQERNAANQSVPPSNWFYSGSFKCIH
jgi:hypothetical protein